jgi:TolB protein
MRKLRGLIFILFIGLAVKPFLVTAQTTAIPTPQLPGRIAYVGIDHNIHTLNPQNNTRSDLTQDGGILRQYLWPTWSNDGRLAYFSSMTTQGKLTTDIYVSNDGYSSGNLLTSIPDHYFTYAYWSPQNCSDGAKCRDLAVLLSNPADILFSAQLIRNSEILRTQSVGRGAPFYYSWSPDGKQMIWQRNNQNMDIFDATSHKIVSTLSQNAGLFQAPWWSPVDDRLLIGLLNTDKRSTNLAIVSKEDVKILVSQLTGPVSFAWSPNGNYVAYSDRRGPITIVDTGTGKVITRTAVTGVFAFFWSPDSNHIAYVTLATPAESFSAQASNGIKVAALIQQTPGIAWSVLDVKADTTRRYGSFLPSDEMVYLLSFFDQFAQSHRIWSPDSHYLVYSELTQNSQAIISVLDTTQSDAVPFSIAEGVIGIWSFN